MQTSPRKPLVVEMQKLSISSMYQYILQHWLLALGGRVASTRVGLQYLQPTWTPATTYEFWYTCKSPVNILHVGRAVEKLAGSLLSKQKSATKVKQQSCNAGTMS